MQPPYLEILDFEVAEDPLETLQVLTQEQTQARPGSKIKQNTVTPQNL